jgi:serine/threonine-protein kinase
MTNAASLPAAGKEADAKVLEQANRILTSKTFQPVERLKRFLGFVVEETVAGRGDQLKEYLVGIEVFSKESSFDPRNDPIVRVQARRLRARLARYYREEGQNDEVLIDLPKGGYAPTFHRMQAAAPKRSVTAALVSRNTVLVKPFSDDSATGDQDHFCRGIAEEIIHVLANLEAVRVVIPDRSPQGEDFDLREAAGRVNAGMIIGGSVRRAGDVLRIAVHMIDASTGCYLWSVELDRREDGTFACQEEVARLVLERLKAGLVGGHLNHARRPTENLAAYNLFLQGRYLMSQRTEEGLRKAAEIFEKAIGEDPQYAQAYSGLADSYGLLAHYGVLAPAEVWTKAASNAAWAVLLDENSADAHASFAHVKSTQDWDWAGSEREYLRAIQLDPRHATAHHWYAVSCLVPMARLDQAVEEMQTARALDPISPIIARDNAVVHYYKRDFDTALEQADRAIEQHPHFPAVYWTLGLIQEQIGDFDESIAAYQRALQLSPKSPRIQGALSRTLAIAGKREEARRILQELLGLAARRYVSPFELASINFALQEHEEGYRWLEKAFQDRCFELISIRVDPKFDALRRDSRFIALVSQLGLH